MANLWDVTDKDIDKFASSVFERVGLGVVEGGAAGTVDGSGRLPRESLAAAVGHSRDVPLLKYLNGAAPVVYGVPVWFE